MVSYEGEERRKKIANEIGQGLMGKLSWPPYRWEVFAPPFTLLQEGVMCYVNGLFMASSLMARASVETAVYLAITTDIYANEGDSQKVDLSYDKKAWDHILAKAHDGTIKGKRVCEGLHYLTKADVKDILYVREYGNIVAHWGQRVHRRARESQQADGIVKHYAKRADPFTFAQTVSTVNVSKFLVNEAKATTILRKSVKVLNSMADRI